MKMKKMLALALAMAMSLSLVACGSSDTHGESAEEGVPQPNGYPSKTIDFIVPAPAGALMDLSTRALESVADFGTKSVAITNMPGASNTIGTTEIYGRPADGYTLGMANLSSQICQPLRGNTEYSMEDFRHLAYVQNPEQMVLVASKDSGLETFEQLVEKMSAGEEVFFTCANAGAVAHLAMLGICDQLSLPAPTYVSYSGSAEVVSAILGNQVDIAVTDITVAKEYYEAGEMTVLLTITDDVTTRMPDVPCAGDKGMSDMNFYTSPMWVVVHKDTPDEIVEWLKQQINEAILSDEYQAYLESSNMEPFTEILTEEEITETLTGMYETYKVLYDKYF